MASSDCSIWHCCTIPTLYTSMIAREVKMQLPMMSSVLASNFVRRVSLWIKMLLMATANLVSPLFWSGALVGRGFYDQFHIENFLAS